MDSNKLKKIIYSILKEITKGDFVPDASNYEINEDDFVKIIELMIDEGYLNRKYARVTILDSVEIENTPNTVTMKGINFLEENSTWNKFYKGIKEFKSFLTI